MAIYFDNAATSFPKPDEACKAMLHYQRELGVSSGRGAYRKALEVDGMVFKTRRLLGRLFNIKDGVENAKGAGRRKSAEAHRFVLPGGRKI